MGSESYFIFEKYDIIITMDYHDYIWDLGGTLLDNYGMSTRAFVLTLGQFGRPATHQQVYNSLRQSTATAVQEFAADIPDFLRSYKRKEAELLEKPVLFQGAQEVLQKIVNSGGRNFLISHRDNHVLELLDKTGIRSYFTEIITSENGFARKPDPQRMLYLKEKYQIASGLVIGDRSIDIEAGEAAGFATLLVDGSQSLLTMIT